MTRGLREKVRHWGKSDQEGEGGIAEMEENDVSVEQEINGWSKSQ